MGTCWPVVVAFPLFVSIILLSTPISAAYENFTVGGSDGWTPTPTVSYTEWASGKNFTLGDYLIFNYAKDQYDVIRTYNETVYKTCDYLDSTDGDFDVWGEPGTTNFSAIPLVQTGPTYFFSGVNGSTLCKAGMKFAINVSTGDGLPANLATRPPPPPPPNANPPSSPTNPSTNNNQGNGVPHMNHHSFPYLVALLLCATLLPRVLSS